MLVLDPDKSMWSEEKGKDEMTRFLRENVSERLFRNIQSPSPVTQWDFFAIRALPFVTKLSPVHTHEGHGAGWGVSLRYSAYEEYDSCTQKQEFRGKLPQPFLLSNVRPGQTTPHISSRKRISTCGLRDLSSM
jgi:hypothetical protein